MFFTSLKLKKEISHKIIGFYGIILKNTFNKQLNSIFNKSLFKNVTFYKN